MSEKWCWHLPPGWKGKARRAGCKMGKGWVLGQEMTEWDKEGVEHEAGK